MEEMLLAVGGIYYLAGKEVAEAHAQLDGGGDYVSTLTRYYPDSSVKMERLVGQDVADAHHRELAENTDGALGASIVRAVWIDTKKGQLPALLVEAHDFQAGIAFQMQFPLELGDGESGIVCYRTILTHLENIAPDEQESTIEIFLTTLNSELARKGVAVEVRNESVAL